MSRLRSAAAAACCLAVVLVPAGEASAKPRVFKNCTALHKVYPHGVGTKTAHDKVTSGKPVTNFKRSTALYNANKKSDRDKDHVACEAR